MFGRSSAPSEAQGQEAATRASYGERRWRTSGSAGHAARAAPEAPRPASRARTCDAIPMRGALRRRVVVTAAERRAIRGCDQAPAVLRRRVAPNGVARPSQPVRRVKPRALAA